MQDTLMVVIEEIAKDVSVIRQGIFCVFFVLIATLIGVWFRRPN